MPVPPHSMLCSIRGPLLLTPDSVLYCFLKAREHLPDRARMKEHVASTC
jgi:hypothetical protein